MADLLLKKGSYSDFKTKIFDPSNNIKNAVEGALYFTEDEGGLYLGKADKTVVRIQGTVHQYDTLKNFAEGIQPPYSKDIIYFIADKDALVRWNGSEWIQLNTPASISSEMSSNIAGLTLEVGNLKDAINGVGAGENHTPGLNDRLATAEIEIDELQAAINGVGEGENHTPGIDERLTILWNDVNTGYTDDEDNEYDSIKEQLKSLADTDTQQNEKLEDIDKILNGTTEAGEEVPGVLENIENLQSEIDVINEALGLSDATTGESFASRLDIIEEEVFGTGEEGSQSIRDDLLDLYTEFNELKTAATDFATKTELTTVNTTLTESINALNTKTNTTDTNLTNLTNRVTKTETDIATHDTKLTEIINDLEKTATKQELSDLSEELKREIDSDIIAANAMTYKGGVASKDDLPTTAAIGDTYIVTNEEGFALTDTIKVYAGDLIIAQSKDGTETDGVIPSDQLKWDHVSTGYSHIYNPKLKAENIGDANVITLADFADEPIGQIYLESASENIVISIDSEKDNTVKFELQWGSF